MHSSLCIVILFRNTDLAGLHVMHVFANLNRFAFSNMSFKVDLQYDSLVCPVLLIHIILQCNVIHKYYKFLLRNTAHDLLTFCSHLFHSMIHFF